MTHFHTYWGRGKHFEKLIFQGALKHILRGSDFCFVAHVVLLFCFYRQLPHIMTAAQAMTASRYCSNLLFIIQVRWTKHLGRMNPTILHEKITTCGLDAYSTAVAAEQKPSSNTTVPVMSHQDKKIWLNFKYMSRFFWAIDENRKTSLYDVSPQCH